MVPGEYLVENFRWWSVLRKKTFDATDLPFHIAGMKRYVPKFSGVSQKLTRCHWFGLQHPLKWGYPNSVAAKKGLFKHFFYKNLFLDKIWLNRVKTPLIINIRKPWHRSFKISHYKPISEQSVSCTYYTNLLFSWSKSKITTLLLPRAENWVVSCCSSLTLEETLAVFYLSQILYPLTAAWDQNVKRQ